ncbi:MAG: hypothetical protein GKC09_03375 [Methanosarcinales archaeon]|nr:hypothetical protein [Methanosarcinales archaeon]
MKISVQIEGEEVAAIKSGQGIAPEEILEKAAALGAEDAGQAPALVFGKLQAGMLVFPEPEEAAFSIEMAIDCGGAPEKFRSDAAREMVALEASIEQTEAKDAGKAAQGEE